MNMKSRRVLVRALALIIPAIVICASCSKPISLVTQVVNMIAVHNRHDVAGQMAFFADDATFVIADQTPIVGKAAIRDLYRADSVMKSELVYSDLRVSGDTVIVGSVVERNDLLRLLGLPDVHYLPGTRLVFKKGLIQRFEASRLDQKQWREMRDSFAALMTWLQTAHPELMREVTSGRLAGNNAESAGGWMKLAGEWRESQAAKQE